MDYWINTENQASLRRAVSTAYYALFHLLISEATLNWKQSRQRPVLARHFEHGKMKSAAESQRTVCGRILNANPPRTLGAELEFVRKLRRVTDAFLRAQEQRHIADYVLERNTR